MKLFKRSETTNEFGEAVSLLNEGLVFKDSHITGCGNLKISCLVEGDIEIDGDVHIKDAGIFKGNITCTNLTVEGSVTGDTVFAGQTISIVKGGCVVSNITCSGLNISENSTFNGACNMRISRDSIVKLERDQVAL